MTKKIGQAEFTKSLIILGVTNIDEFEKQMVENFPKSNIAQAKAGSSERSDRILALYNYANRLAKTTWKARHQKKLEAGQMTAEEVEAVLAKGIHPAEPVGLVAA